MAYLDAMDERTGFLPTEATRDLGKELAARYQAADPFPSITIDDFLPTKLADEMLAHFGPAHDSDETRTFDRDQERYKSSYHPDTVDDVARSVFYAFNSRPFIRVLENITGIKGLIPDPYFLGAGFHEIKTGGHLSVHADFNHHKPLNVERRINVLIYLNKDWEDAFGGQLELWDTAMTRRVQSLVPSFNRCVIFNTTSDSMHGNPNVVRHPRDVSRKSIALYYYTSTWTDLKRSHDTQFRVRPSSADRTDWQVRIDGAMQDYVPPVLLRGMKRAMRGVRRLTARG